MSVGPPRLCGQSLEIRRTRSTLWSGRGKPPRWLSPQLRAGRKLDDYLIDRSARKRHHKASQAR
ncbi:H-NS family nucleoid-associated regulatory protein [Bradyrhizobium sp. CCGUVB14]|uniref:H-NS family nucleoid-associated regulatory protein n=1 Tax=Bradyrhizobium sp. CCGUVB14 TaxID=2949628 RepID=UPI0035BF1DF9